MKKITYEEYQKAVLASHLQAMRDSYINRLVESAVEENNNQQITQDKYDSIKEFVYSLDTLELYELLNENRGE